MANLEAPYAASVVSRNSPGLTSGPADFSLVSRTLRTAHPTLAHQKSWRDWPVVAQSATVAISGTVFTSGPIPSPGTTVKLVRQADDQVVATALTDANGHYFFERDVDDPYTYYVIGYTAATSPQVHGLSDRGQVPA